MNGQTLGHLQKPIPLTPKLSAFSAARFRDPTEDRMHLPPDWVEVVPPGWGTRGKSYYKNSCLVGDWYGYQCHFFWYGVGGKVGKGSIVCAISCNFIRLGRLRHFFDVFQKDALK